MHPQKVMTMQQRMFAAFEPKLPIGGNAENRQTKIECLSHYSEINCNDTYEEWTEFENYRKLYPFPKYTSQGNRYKTRHF